MAGQRIISKQLAGAEDLLLDASGESTVVQQRASGTRLITKINAATIPLSGKLGDDGFKSISTKLSEVDTKLSEVDDTISKASTSVIDRDAMLSRIGVRNGEIVLQEDINLFYTWDDSIVEANDNGGTILYVSNGGWRAKYSGAVKLSWFMNLTEAVKVASGRKLLIDIDLDISSPITLEFKGSQEWVLLGSKTFTNASTIELDTMLDIRQNGFSFTIGSGLTLLSNNLCRTPIKIYNIDIATTLDLSVVVKDVFSNTVGYGSIGVLIAGEYTTVLLNKVAIYNVSRGIGVGVLGSQGSAGVVVTYIDDKYSKHTEVRNLIVDNVTNMESTDSTDNVDCDGLKIFAPENTGATCIIDYYKAINCKGRAYKSQVDFNLINYIEVIRDKEEGISEASDIDFQYGNGKVCGGTFIYNETDDGLSTLGLSHKVINCSFRGDKVYSGTFIVDGIEVINNIPESIDTLPYLCTALSDETAMYKNTVVLKNINNSGVGSTNYGLKGTLETYKSLTISNCSFNRLSTTLVYTANSLYKRFMTSDISIVSQESTALVPLAMSGSTSTFRLNAYGCRGFTEDTLESNMLVENISTNVIKTNMIVPDDPTIAGGGSIATEAVTLDDDATHVFKKRGYEMGAATFFIQSNYSRVVAGVFAMSSKEQLDLTNGATTSIEYGNDTNNDVDGKLNIWTDANNCINIKNRLGSTRVFTLVSIG